jgi:LPXTG-motif cell wall-anchored protein
VDAPTVPSAPPSTPFVLTTDRGTITTATVGQALTVVGDGFLPFSTVTVVIYSTPTVLGTVVTDAAGTFSKPVTIPDLVAGAHTLVAYGTDSSGNPRSMALAVTVGGTPARPTATTTATSSHGTLAYTGFEAVPAVALAGGLLVAGAALLLVARRRRTAPAAAEQVSALD